MQDPGARPTETDKPRAPRGRRRPDPLAEVSEQLKGWFTQEPWRTSRELLEKLQASNPAYSVKAQLVPPLEWSPAPIPA